MTSICKFYHINSNLLLIYYTNSSSCFSSLWHWEATGTRSAAIGENTDHTVPSITRLHFSLRIGLIEQSLTSHPTQYRLLWRRSSHPITWLLLTNKQ